MVLSDFTGEFLSCSARLGVADFAESFFAAETLLWADLDFATDFSAESTFAFLGCAFVETFAESVFLAIGFFAVDLRGADFTDFLSVTGAVYLLLAEL